MASMLPVAVYGLKVPAGEVLIEATTLPATFRVTMAAIDPSADTSDSSLPARSTLKLLYERPKQILDDSDGDSEDDDENAFLKALREEIGSSEEEDSDELSDDEEKNGGPSDPSKSVKARKEAAAQDLLSSLLTGNSDDESDDDMEIDALPKTNGLTKASTKDKGKGKAKLAELLDDDSDIEAGNLEEVVLCTLDPAKTYQQPIDITVHEDQRTFFKVSGTHAVYLSGNYVIAPDDDHESPDGEDDEYDLSPDEDELDLDGDESDELDDVEDPRFVEVGTDDEAEAPKLVKTEDAIPPKKQKGKNKRPAEESDGEDAKAATIDDLMSKSLKAEEATTNGDAKLSKKQLKKLKNNAGKPIEAQVEAGKKPENPAKVDKKVQFAKNLETGPSSSPSSQPNGAIKPEVKSQAEQSKATTGVKVVQGVKVDDKKVGSGPQAKKGDTLGMRYIGKLSNGKVFDANKKGPPFRFKLGAGDVIKGWDIGVSGMSVQGERRIVVPAHLAYGNKRMDDIPANSELTFDIKLLEISKK